MRRAGAGGTLVGGVRSLQPLVASASCAGFLRPLDAFADPSAQRVSPTCQPNVSGQRVRSMHPPNATVQRVPPDASAYASAASGKRNSARSPCPWRASCSVTLPPKRAAISREIASPRPEPGSSWPTRR